MPTPIEAVAPTRVSDASLKPRSATVHPSPLDWRDQILYFLLPDRFSDGKESTRPKFDPQQPDQFRAVDRAAWMAAGKRFQHGTIRGIKNQIPYLKDLGVTTLWIGPVWKQRAGFDDYHGYGIQNFLEVDPSFGTRQDLRDLVDTAHAAEMYVLLDIIYNHSGNNWFYRKADGSRADEMPYRASPPYDPHGWRAPDGSSVQTIASVEDGVWPRDFQDFDWYTRAGSIGNFDLNQGETLGGPENEFRRGDFFSFKDLRINPREPRSGEVLNALINVYRYWIALTDCDGFRIDTCKHLQEEASRHFCGGIREYAESIGKENFLILGEVAGGPEMARDYLSIFGKNLDAVLDIIDPPRVLIGMAKGMDGVGGEKNSAQQFFAQFDRHDAIGSHRELGRYHVSVLDDHDMIGRSKRRFSAQNESATRNEQVAHAVGIQLTTLGIPCIYYGTEQAFDGGEQFHDTTIEPLNRRGEVPYADRYIRESMFGGTFGAFETTGCHFFDPDHPAYLRIAAIAAVVKTKGKIGMALRRGRQYPRDVRITGPDFVPPQRGEIVAWSRILFDCEVLVAVNTHGTEARGADVTVDAQLHAPGKSFNVLYRSDRSDTDLRNPPTGQTIPVHPIGDRATVRIDLPPAGMIILG